MGTHVGFGQRPTLIVFYSSVVNVPKHDLRLISALGNVQFLCFFYMSVVNVPKHDFQLISVVDNVQSDLSTTLGFVQRAL